MMITFINYTGFTQIMMPNGYFEEPLGYVKKLNYLINLYLHGKLKTLDVSFIKNKSLASKISPFIT